MRGTNNRKAFDLFWEGAKLRRLPLTYETWQQSDRFFRQAIEEDTGLSFEEARRRGTGYPRAWSWIAYGITMSHFLGRPEPKEALIGEALEHAGRALALDPNDYQHHWVAAFIHVANGNAERALHHMDEALYLNGEDFNTQVMNEMADVLVWLGRVDDAIKWLERSRRVSDWNRWSMAWAYYFKGREDPGYYDKALEEIEQVFWQPDSDRHQVDVQQLAAAIHHRKAELCDRRGDRTGASRERQLAGAAAGQFQDKRKGWTKSDEQRRMPFHETAKELERHWLDSF